MRTVVTRLAPYRDERGNKIVFNGALDDGVTIKFSGSNNRLIVADPVRLAQLRIDFDCDNGVVKIGSSEGVPTFAAAIRVGQDSTVRIGKNVSSTGIVTLSAVEGTTIIIGTDVMFASENQVRGDDGHPIFDVHTGERVNVAESIRIGNHVWLGRFATVLGGARVGSGTVIGYGAIVTGPIPNNCVAAGIPARVLRPDIAWERPHLSLTPPYYKPDASTVIRSKYWRPTESDPAITERSPAKMHLRTRFARSRVGRKVLNSRAVRRGRRNAASQSG